MASSGQLTKLGEGVEAWNVWRRSTNHGPVDLSGARLAGARLEGIDLLGANLRGADLDGARLGHAQMSGANLTGARIDHTDLEHVRARGAIFDDVRGEGARFLVSTLRGASFRRARLYGADFYRAYLRDARLDDADLTGARLAKANLERASCARALLADTDLRGASLVRTRLVGADLRRARVYGVAAWSTSTLEARQDDLVIVRTSAEPPIFVDDLGSAHLLSLMLDNDSLRACLDGITSRFVLILGRFTDERKAVLDRMRESLRMHGYVAVMFDFDRPSSRTFNETIRIFAGLSRFVVADLTDAKVVLDELSAILSAAPSVPVRPVLQVGRPIPLTALDHVQRASFLFPPHRYENAVHLVATMHDDVIRPAEACAEALIERVRSALRDC